MASGVLLMKFMGYDIKDLSDEERLAIMQWLIDQFKSISEDKYGTGMISI